MPAARYWSFQLYPMGTFEHLDLHDRITSLNHTQLRVDDDGKVRVAVGGDDPGWPNWLDSGGRARGMVIFRWFWPTDSDVGAVAGDAGREVRRDPRGAPRRHPRRGQRRSGAGRSRRRRDHLAWRFRT